MKVRRLVIEVLYDEANDDKIVVCLDKMTTDWLIRDDEVVIEYNSELGEPTDPVIDDWEYFYPYVD